MRDETTVHPTAPGVTPGTTVRQADNPNGTNTFVPVSENSMRFTIRGDLKVDAAKVRGVPRLLAGTVGPAIESFLVARIQPNFLTVAKGVERWLRDGGDTKRSP